MTAATSNTTIACVFPGQGSQSLNMMDGLVDLPVVQQTYEEAADALGFDVLALSQTPTDPQAINQTANTQPAMLAAGIATWRAWQAAGGPVANTYSGHSLGEWTALVATNVLSFADALNIVRLRGEQMQAAVPADVGAMAAILGLSNEQVEQLAKDASTTTDVVVAANYNAPGQVVVSGTKIGVEQLIEQAKAVGAKRALPLPVSVPSHSPLMQPAVTPVRDALTTHINTAADATQIVSFNGTRYSDSADIIERLPNQLVQPIRWDNITTELAATHAFIIESGPGKVLTGLNKRALKGQPVQPLAIFDSASIDQALEFIQHSDKQEAQHG